MRSNRYDHRVLDIRKVEGRIITSVIDVEHRWKEYSAGVRAPDNKHLANFDVPFGDDTLLVLDPYGDEAIPDEIRTEIGLSKMSHMTIGILRETGEVVHVGLIEQPHRPKNGKRRPPTLSLTFWGVGGTLASDTDAFIVPKKYLKRLDELKNKKRPFTLTLWDEGVMHFVTRWVGYQELAKSLIVDLHFNKRRIQIWGDSYREVTPYMNTKTGK